MQKINLSLTLILMFSLPTSAIAKDSFTINENPKDIQQEVNSISLQQEATVQKAPKARPFQLGISFGATNLKAQSYQGREGDTAHYQADQRPSLLGRLSWSPETRFGFIGLSQSISYFNLDTDQVSLHFVPVGLGPIYKLKFSKLELSLGYEFLMTYIEQVGLDQAKNADWFSGGRMHLSAEVPLANFGIGDRWTNYKVGLSWEATNSKNAPEGVDLNTQSWMIGASLTL